MDTPTTPQQLCPRCWGRAVSPACALCMGEGLVPDLLLSPHFRLSECVASETALRKGIANDPSADIVDHLRGSARELWEPARMLLGAPLVVSSGYRSESLNLAIGGSASSVHCAGYALDFRPAALPLDEAMRRIVASRLTWDQVIFEFGRWLHLGWQSSAGQQRHQALMIFEPDRYLVWNPRDSRVEDCA